MRLWSLHPRYLDAKGLVALWREALLAQAVLRGGTVGYRNHPQLTRFKATPDPLAAMARYLIPVQQEATRRGYRFDRSKIGATGEVSLLPVTHAQLDFEWQHLLRKLALRDPAACARWQMLDHPDPHPLFVPTEGPLAPWERA